MSEHKIATINAYGKNSVGCLRHEADAMISYQIQLGGDITDLFLTQEQATHLLSMLSRNLEANEKEPTVGSRGLGSVGRIP